LKTVFLQQETVTLFFDLAAAAALQERQPVRRLRVLGYRRGPVVNVVAEEDAASKLSGEFRVLKWVFTRINSLSCCARRRAKLEPILSALPAD
jgi:hypothetical protein